MATKTRRELVDQALKDLGVLPAGHTPSAEDVETVDGYVDTVLEQLSEDSVVYVQDDEAIEASIFLPLAKCLADACRDEFGVPAFDVEGAKTKLRRLTASKTTRQPVKSEYF